MYTSHVLEHCENPDQALLETVRVANKRIIHIVPDGNVDEKNFGSKHIHKFNRKNYIELFESNNLEITLFESIQDLHMNSLIIVSDVK